MDLRSWGWDVDLDALSQQFQENMQKAQEMMNVYSLDNLQQELEDTDNVGEREQSAPLVEVQHNYARSYENTDSKEMEEVTPPHSARGMPSATSGPIEVTRLAPGTMYIPAITPPTTATTTPMKQTSEVQAVRKRSDSKRENTSPPKGFFSDDSDVDLENDPILNRSRQRQLQSQKSLDNQQLMQQRQQQQHSQAVDVESQMPTLDPDNDKKQKPSQPFMSAFDKLASSSSFSLESVRQKLGFGSGRTAATQPPSSSSQQLLHTVRQQCTTGRRFHVMMVVLGLIMLAYFWRFTASWN